MIDKKRALELVKMPEFIKFVDYYLKEWLKYKGWGRWLYEYQQMQDAGLFKPSIFKALYIKELEGTLNMGFIKEEPIHYVGASAADATESYYTFRQETLYKICVITGEIAEDNDGDLYVELTYEEATQICKALNDEMEEELFKIERM